MRCPLILYIPLLLFACARESTRKLPLPYKEAGINLTDSIIREIEWGEFSLRIQFNNHKKGYFDYNDSPFLYVLNANGTIIDSLKLFEHQPYSGTDSHYWPWIEISKAGIITRTDTSVYYVNKPLTKIGNEKFQVQEMDVDTTISVEKFKISRSGKFSKIK